MVQLNIALVLLVSAACLVNAKPSGSDSEEREFQAKDRQFANAARNFANQEKKWNKAEQDEESDEADWARIKTLHDAEESDFEAAMEKAKEYGMKMKGADKQHAQEEREWGEYERSFKEIGDKWAQNSDSHSGSKDWDAAKNYFQEMKKEYAAAEQQHNEQESKWAKIKRIGKQYMAAKKSHDDEEREWEKEEESHEDRKKVFDAAAKKFEARKSQWENADRVEYKNKQAWKKNKFGVE